MYLLRKLVQVKRSDLARFHFRSQFLFRFVFAQIPDANKNNWPYVSIYVTLFVSLQSKQEDEWNWKAKFDVTYMEEALVFLESLPDKVKDKIAYNIS